VSDEQTPKTPAPSELELLRAEVRAGFTEMRAGFSEMRAGIAGAASATAVAAEFKTVRAEMADSRTHMDVIAERIESHVKLVAEVNSHHATVLDNHERRLQKIEKRA